MDTMRNAENYWLYQNYNLKYRLFFKNTKTTKNIGDKYFNIAERGTTSDTSKSPNRTKNIKQFKEYMSSMESLKELIQEAKTAEIIDEIKASKIP